MTATPDSGALTQDASPLRAGGGVVPPSATSARAAFLLAAHCRVCDSDFVVQRPFQRACDACRDAAA